MEIKAERRVRLSDLRHLEIFLSDYSGRARFAVVLHDTDVPHMITRGIVGLPVSAFT